MADGYVPLEWRQARLIEDLGNQSHVLDHGHAAPVGDGDASRFLTSVLEREETKEGEVGNVLARGVDPEDAAGFVGFVVRGHQRSVPQD
jgi:hypothetical protein